MSDLILIKILVGLASILVVACLFFWLGYKVGKG